MSSCQLFRMLNFPSLLFFLFSSLSILQVSSGSQEITKTVVVDPNGHGNFTKIQEAIDSIPDGNDQWIKIHISTGVFWEKVNIGGKKGFIILEGEGAQNTFIQWGDHHPTSTMGLTMDKLSDTWLTATFVSQAHNVILSGITFKNTYLSRTDVQVGIAALIGGDKTCVYSCNFIGVQDTLADQTGRHYFKNCYIEGATDFIFGFGQSIYENCRLSAVWTSKKERYVTAQGRSDDKNDKSGFVFKNCYLTGTGKTYLGRAWRTYARVLFYQTYMQDIIAPEGWQSWFAADGGTHTTFAEYGCSGPGSRTSGRVPWEKKLSNDEVRKLVDISYVNDDRWLQQQPAGFRYEN